jgi:hypothetical protein
MHADIVYPKLCQPQQSVPQRLTIQSPIAEFDGKAVIEAFRIVADAPVPRLANHPASTCALACVL